MDRQTAYDVTRREFYRLRQAEEIERRVAPEEARYVGAYFGKDRTEVGMMLEDNEYEKWKVWAAMMAARRERMSQISSSSGRGDEEAVEVEAELNAEVEGMGTAAGAKPAP